MDITKFENLEHKLLKIREENVLLDSDVAELYGVETKRINEAVKNNPDKFPDGYIIELTKEEREALKSNFSTSKTQSDRHSSDGHSARKPQRECTGAPAMISSAATRQSKNLTCKATAFRMFDIQIGATQSTNSTAEVY
ncbi:MAG: ORF6N domain-containing protein [Campylobacterales bacterium]|nr:ORF6N domain-containing protein [Campylobacterales bacterium]